MSGRADYETISALMKPRWKSEADPDQLVEARLDTVEDIVRLMTDRRIRHVPVVTQDAGCSGLL